MRLAITPMFVLSIVLSHYSGNVTRTIRESESLVCVIDKNTSEFLSQQN